MVYSIRLWMCTRCAEFMIDIVYVRSRHQIKGSLSPVDIDVFVAVAMAMGRCKFNNVNEIK